MEKLHINVANAKYPFYKTMRGVLLFSESGFTSDQMMAGDARAILHFLYCYIKGACRREDIEFNYDFEKFIDQVDAQALKEVEKYLIRQGKEQEVDSDSEDDTKKNRS